jgi:hypothetical protein
VRCFAPTQYGRKSVSQRAFHTVFEFIEDLKKGDLSKYKPVYIRTLKHRILKKKHEQLTNEALLINEILHKVESL